VKLVAIGGLPPCFDLLVELSEIRNSKDFNTPTRVSRFRVKDFHLSSFSTR
jgi:hypothetical protein